MDVCWLCWLVGLLSSIGRGEATLDYVVEDNYQEEIKQYYKSQPQPQTKEQYDKAQYKPSPPRALAWSGDGGKEAGPQFDVSLPRGVTVVEGRTAKLRCRVFNLEDKKVSWIRGDDLTILTVDRYIYTTDRRVWVEVEGPEWTLVVKGVEARDAGVYECQVSTRPVMSYVVTLTVIAKGDVELTTPVVTTPMMTMPVVVTDGTLERPQAEQRVTVVSIVNGPEVVVSAGHPVNLTCLVHHTAAPPLYVMWTKDHTMLSVGGDDGGVVMTQTGHHTSSSVLVARASPKHAGTYTCSDPHGKTASIELRVIVADSPKEEETARLTSSRVLVPLAAISAAAVLALTASVLSCACCN